MLSKILVELHPHKLYVTQLKFLHVPQKIKIQEFYSIIFPRSPQMTRRGVSIAKRLHRHFHLGHHHGLRVRNDWMLNATIAGWLGTYPDHILIILLSNLGHSYVPNLEKSQVNRNLQRDYLLKWCYLTQLDTLNVCLRHKIVPRVWSLEPLFQVLTTCHNWTSSSSPSTTIISFISFSSA